MECGIVGPPQSGKTTLFNILTGQLDNEDYRVRREPVRGVAQLHDSRLDILADFYKARKTTPASMIYVDVPGFSSSDENREPFPAQYLAALRGVDMLALVVRDFQNPVVPLPLGGVDPLREINNANLEFIVNDLIIVERRLERLLKVHEPDLKLEEEILQRCQEALSNDHPLRELEFSDTEAKIIKSFAFLSLKPLLIVVNMDDKNASSAKDRLKVLHENTAGFEKNVGWVAVAAGIESEIHHLDKEDRAPFLADLGFKLPTLDRIIKSTFDLLGLLIFFTVSEKECRAWQIPDGSTAAEAAGTIHNDMERGFIRAEVFRWDEVIQAGSESRLKELGRIRLEGRNYLVKDGDVLFIRFNV